MESPQKVDLIVIGAGSGGIGASAVANRFGLRVLLIDRKALYFGGDCLNFGCVPSKALLHVASLFQKAREAEAFGLQTSGKADLSKVLQYIHERQNVIRAHEDPGHFRKEGMLVEVGEASFLDEKTVSVNGKQFTAPKIVLATGSRPRSLRVPGAELPTLYTNETLFFDPPRLPDHLLVIGGGPIGCEMAQAFRRLGSEVTIVQQGERLVDKELPEFSTILQEQLEKEGIKILLNCQLEKFANAHTASLTQGSKSFTQSFDAGLVAIGREIRTDTINLATAGIELKDDKIIADEYYRTTNPRVYVVGDAYGEEQFSHGAEMHNRDLARNFIVPIFKKKHTLEHFSWVTFTDPEIATFGRGEDYLKKNQIDYVRVDQRFEEDDRAIAADYRYARLVLFLTKPKGLFRKQYLLGGSMIAPHAGELIQELILALQEGIEIGAIFNKIYPYPTMSRINQKAITGERQKLLSDRLRNLLGWLYRH